jgi:hypothetical protein
MPPKKPSLSLRAAITEADDEFVDARCVVGRLQSILNVAANRELRGKRDG